MQNNPKLILASASPQRKRILKMLGVPFVAIASKIDENFGTLKKPHAIVKRLALMKARAVAELHPRKWVLGVDTLVILNDGTISGKPGNRNQAKKTILSYSNSFCDVYSGIALVHLALNKKFVHYEKTRIYFHNFDAQTVETYLNENTWQGSSGSMTIEGMGGKLIRRMSGEYWNVVGLPINTFKKWRSKIK